jgi:hypothetical protein
MMSAGGKEVLLIVFIAYFVPGIEDFLYYVDF